MHTAGLGLQRSNKAVTVGTADMRAADKKRGDPGQGQGRRRTEGRTDSSRADVFRGHLFVSLCASVGVGRDSLSISHLYNRIVVLRESSPVIPPVG